MEERAADVVVVGAGVAGLVAAARVRAAGRSVAVLEARPDRVGGRLETVSVSGHAVDLGGTWIGADHARARALVAELGLRLRATSVAGRAVVADDGRLASERQQALRHPVAELSQRRASARLDSIARALPPAAPWAAPDAQRLDAETLDSWLRRHVVGSRSRAVLRGTLANILATDAEQVSLLHALAYLRSNGGWRALLATAGGAQQDMVEGGAQSIADRMAERLGDAVVLGAPVRALEHGAGGVRAVSDGVVVNGRAGVVALPPALAARVVYAPPLAGARDQLWQRMPHGDVIKVVAVYDEAFWRGAGLSGESWGRDLPYSFSYDVADASGRPGALATFFVGERARVLRVLGEDEWRDRALAGLAHCFGAGASRPAAVVVRDWAAEPWTRGAYGGFMGPGAWTGFGSELRTPAGPIAFCGAETAVDAMGYVEGAIQSGERAADEVLARLAG